MDAWDVWLFPHEGDALKLGRVRAETHEEAMGLARQLVEVLPVGAAICLQKPGGRVSQEARQRALFGARLWRAADQQRVSSHMARRRKRRRRATSPLEAAARLRRDNGRRKP